MNIKIPERILILDEQCTVLPTLPEGCAPVAQLIEEERASWHPNERFHAALTPVRFEKGPGGHVLILNGTSAVSKIVRVDHRMFLSDLLAILQAHYPDGITGAWQYGLRGNHCGVRMSGGDHG